MNGLPLSAMKQRLLQGLAYTALTSWVVVCQQIFPSGTQADGGNGKRLWVNYWLWTTIFVDIFQDALKAVSLLQEKNALVKETQFWEFMGGSDLAQGQYQLILVHSS